MLDRIILKIKEIVHYILHINIYAGKEVILRGVPKLLYAKKISFGKNVRLNDKVFLHAAKGITIKDNTTLSYGVAVITESYNISNYEMYKCRNHSGASITIGENVWICANSIILPGVTIADDIIVGAGSVVTRSLLESNSLYAGNPAKFIKKLEWKE